jgi:hypothetical protein
VGTVTALHPAPRSARVNPREKTAARLLGSSAKNSYAQRSTSTGIYRRAHLVP